MLSEWEVSHAMAGENVIRDAEVLLHPTRYRIVEAIRKHPNGLYINQLADMLKEDRQLVSFHLLALESGGYLEGEYEIAKKPASKGRAVKVYRLTPKVEQTLDALRKQLEHNLGGS